MKYGTYTTLDFQYHTNEDYLTLTSPTHRALSTQFLWLSTKLKEIGGSVRISHNQHDFGEYPAFEIDLPYNLQDLDEDEIGEIHEEYDAWIAKYEEIEKQFIVTFTDDFDYNKETI